MSPAYHAPFVSLHFFSAYTSSVFALLQCLHARNLDRETDSCCSQNCLDAFMHRGKLQSLLKKTEKYNEEEKNRLLLNIMSLCPVVPRRAITA